MTQLFEYDAQHLRLLRAVLQSPGIKIGELVDQTGIQYNSVLRYSTKLEQDGWLVRRLVGTQDLSSSHQNVSQPYECYPTHWLTLKAVNAALGRKLAEKRDHPATQEYLRLLELTQGSNPIEVGMSRIVRSIASIALDVQTMNSEILKLEPILSKITQLPGNPDETTR